MSKKLIDDPIKTAILVVGIFGLSLIALGLSWGFLSNNIFPNTIVGIYKKSFWENLVISLHGVLIDLILVAILILWLDHRRTKRASNQQFKEDLEDYALLDFDEINLKKLGHLKRLNFNKVHSVNVQNLVINRMHAKDLLFHDCKMIGLKLSNGRLESSRFSSVRMRSCNFEKTEIKATEFIDCILLKSKFAFSTLKGVSFEKSILERCDFSDADLQSTIFKSCNLTGATFANANLNRANLMNAVGVDVEELSKAKSLDYIQIEVDILEKLKDIRPDMNYQGKGRP
ncbi:Pentapeptide repeats (8 copies) [compost metagenome]